MVIIFSSILSTIVGLASVESLWGKTVLIQNDDPTYFASFNFGKNLEPDFAFLTVQLAAGQTLNVEAAAMATMSTNMEMKTKIGGGFARMLSGESIFINEYTAQGGPGEIGIAPGSPGDMTHVFMDGGERIFLQSSAFVASGPNVDCDFKWEGCRGFFGGEGFILMQCSGKGDLWFNTYGALIEIPVDGDYVVDTGFVVAFTSGLDYSVESVGGLKSLFFSAVFLSFAIASDSDKASGITSVSLL